MPSSASAFNRGKGKGFPRKVFQAEREPLEEAAYEDEEGEQPPEADDEFFEPQEDETVDASPRRRETKTMI